MIKKGNLLLTQQWKQKKQTKNKRINNLSDNYFNFIWRKNEQLIILCQDNLKKLISMFCWWIIIIQKHIKVLIVPINFNYRRSKSTNKVHWRKVLDKSMKIETDHNSWRLKNSIW